MEHLDEDPGMDLLLLRCQPGQLVRDGVVFLGHVLHLEGDESAVQLPHLFHIRRHLWARVFFVGLLDDELGITPDDQLRDAEA